MAHSNRSDNINWLLFLLAAHIALAFFARTSELVSTGHAALTMLMGVIFALTNKDDRRSIYAVAYISGAEVFWRMTSANIFYESGKYAVAVILLIRLLKMARLRQSFLPIFYFIMLLISIPLTISAFGNFGDAREEISFNLSGPLALSICTLFFLQTKLGKNELEKIAWWMSFPILSILTITMWSLLTSEKIQFTQNSNWITSGGFGPNQVSAVLGLGAVMMFLAILSINSKRDRLLAFGMMVAFLVQSALTFSRGGVYNAAICILLVSLHLIWSKKGRSSAVTLLFALWLMAIYLIIPQLDQYTNGMFSLRFQDTDTTNRVELAQAEIRVWQDNILFGVGPGVVKEARTRFFDRFADAHTEYTRMLAEHGVPGLISLTLLAIMAIRAYTHAPNIQSKVWIVALLAWSFAEMSHAAMRIVSISLLFGMANAVWIEQSTETVKKKSRTSINPKNNETYLIS